MAAFVVRCECVVHKDVYVEDCTEEQARADPWEYAVDEQEVDQWDWKVLSVTPDEGGQ